MTTLLTRFNHPIYADDVINLSITDILDTQHAGQRSVRQLSRPFAERVPFAFTEDLHLLILTTPRNGLPHHTGNVFQTRFDVHAPLSRTGARQSICLSGRWSRVSEGDYDQAVEIFTSRFPTFNTTIGSFTHYQRLPLTLHRLSTEHLILIDEAMFGSDPVTVKVLHLPQPHMSTCVTL